MSTYLVSAGAKHALDAETYGGNVKGRGPVLVQYGQTDVTIGVDVRMYRYIWFDESDLEIIIIIITTYM